MTLEYEPKHAEVARANIARAGLADTVEIRIGPALETLPQLAAEGRGPFDLIFIDADKESYAEYLDWALRLSRRGSLIVADNVVRQGAVVDPADDRPARGRHTAVQRKTRPRSAADGHSDPGRRQQGPRRTGIGPGGCPLTPRPLFIGPTWPCLLRFAIQRSGKSRVNACSEKIAVEGPRPAVCTD